MEQNLDEVIKAISIAIKEAQGAIDVYSLQQFTGLFKKAYGEENENKYYRPVTITLPVPKSDGSYEGREIPLAALLPQHSLKLDEVKVKMSVVARWSEEEKKTKVEIGPLKQQAEENLKCQPGQHEIEMTFKRAESSEGIARVSQSLIKTI